MFGVFENDFRLGVFVGGVGVERRAARVGLYGEGITLKITYADMKNITRSRQVFSTRSAADIYRESVDLLEQVPQQPVRLIGTGLHHLIGEEGRQLHLTQLLPGAGREEEAGMQARLESLHRRYGLDFAGNLDKIFHGDTLYRTVEYMRKHVNRS